MIEYYNIINSEHANITNAHEYYLKNKEIADRYEIKNGKTSYDFDQISQIADLGLHAYRVAKGTIGYDAMRARAWKNSPRLKKMRDNGVLDDYIKKSSEVAVTNIDMAKEIRDRMRERVLAEPSSIQKFSAGMFTEAIRQFTDVRQLPFLLASNYAGAVTGSALSAKIGVESFWGQKLIEAGVSGVFNGAEEMMDRFVNDEPITPEDIAFAAGGAFLFSAAASGVKYAAGKGAKPLDPNLKSKVDKVLSSSAKNIEDRILRESRDITLAELELVREAANNLRPINGVAGRPGAEKAVLKNAVFINGKSVVDSEKAVRTVVNTLIEREDIDFIKSLDDFNKIAQTSPDTIRNLVKVLSEDGSLTPSQKEAFSYASRCMDEMYTTDIDIDMDIANEHLLRNLEGEAVVEYEPIYEVSDSGRIFNKTLTPEEFTKIESKNTIKHNYNDFKGGVLQNQLVRDGMIPEGSDIKYARGYVSKQKVPVYTGTDADGNPVYYRNSWLKGDAVIQAKWTKNGEMFYGEFTLGTDGKYIADVYKMSDSPIGNTVKVSSNKPKDLMEDLHGKVDIGAENISRAADVEAAVSKKLGLNTPAKELTREEIVNRTVRATKEVGATVKRKYKLETIDDVASFYKEKYKIDFDVKTVDNLPYGRLAQVEIKTAPDGSTNYSIGLSKNVNDPELQIGALRHEIQHILDNEKSPDFESKVGKVSEKTGTAKDVLDQANKGHFLGHEDDWWEYSYIVKNEIDNLVTDGKINQEAVKVLGLDMPKILDSEDVKIVQELIEAGENETDISKRLKDLRKQTDVWFRTKRALKDISRSKASGHVQTQQMKDAIKTLVFLPFENKKQGMITNIIDTFTLKDSDGNILAPAQVIGMFDGEKTDLVGYLFYNEELPANLKIYEQQFDSMKTRINEVIENVADNKIIDKNDIISTINYDKINSLEKLIPEDELAKYMDSDNNFDLEKYSRGEKVVDPLTGKDIPEKIIPLRQIFAEKYYAHFNSAIDSLEYEISRKNANGVRIAKALLNAKDCMSPDDLKAVVVKNNLDILYVEVQDVIKNNHDLFQQTLSNATKVDYEANIIASKKKNAALFFVSDMESVKGSESNPALGTFAHALNRFGDAIEEGYISKENVKAFVKANRVSSELGIQRLADKLSTAYALKETVPGGGSSGMSRLINEIQRESLSDYTKTQVRELQSYVKNELGREFGKITKPTKGILDKIVKGFMGWQNKINLTGFKAGSEFLQEPSGISRASAMKYGGPDTLENFKVIMNTAAQLKFMDDEVAKVHKILGGKETSSTALEAIHIISDDLNDFTGYRKKRLEKFGSQADKALAKIDGALNTINLYGATQKTQKLASYKIAGAILGRFTKFDTMDNLLNNSSHFLKGLFNMLGITEADFKLMKNFETTEAFKKYGIFGELEFRDVLTNDKLKSIYGNLSDAELDILRDNLVDKVTKLYDRIASDVSPTELTRAHRNTIDSIQDPVLRNFVEITSNFKNSIQEQWRRLGQDYYYSNINAATGKFDWRNKIYQKRILSHALNSMVFIATTSVLLDLDFYDDPIGTISERIDDLVDKPGSILWNLLDNQFNLWGLTTGANVVKRPLTLGGNIAAGDWDKATTNGMKLLIGTTNYNHLNFVKENILD